jgi:hyperosmotically inducible protein
LEDPTVEASSHSNLGRVLAGVGVGALLMYTLDPQQGRRRMALARDRASHLGRQAGRWAGVGWRDLSHRVSGVGARLGRMVRRDTTDDEILVERVRARIGRVVARPHGVEVSSSSGRVCLRGPVLEQEREQLLRAVRSVPGVRGVDTQLALHPTAATVPGLQGATNRRNGNGSRHLTPGAQLLAVAAGVGVLLVGLAVRRHAP